ncbi:leucyl aminopeptidase family protein [Sphingomonas bacterium]|uniref:leucyl aminopeptidase family protein n=1 Tax=Sphingomonas bacterium TaxID=1895847 RepID=UPI0015760373|nr:leucyl aminopeptidase family protein [Sphingomonas bacterium]
MIALSSLLQPDRGQPAHALHLVSKSGFGEWLKDQPSPVRALLSAAKFEGEAGSLAILPGETPEDWAVAIGADEPLTPWSLAGAAAKLPEGSYRLAAGAAAESALGWLLAQHRFDRYRREPRPNPPRVLLTGDVARIDGIVRIAQATALVRDLIDTPSADLGPVEFARAVEQIGAIGHAIVRTTQGEDLAEGYPMIHAVGRAAAHHRQPRLIELEWGDPAHPRIAIVGKGICFDSGGLDIKPSSGMLLMKKDMGGAAHALALAQLIMAARLPVRLHLLIPAAENAISADAFRPGDVLDSRQGLHVEIGNTDAEGRLVLADALTRACEEQPPELLIDFATLTGAARVALGPELPALFSNDDALAAELIAAGDRVGDPMWRLPLWKPYAEMLKSELADINNAGSGGFAGSVTAALFLERFVAPGVPWAHLDTFAWNPAARPGRPKGGEALGLRAAWALLQARYARPA